jgi:nitrite reductase/ring-hydroxylating ferredoxin subunit
MKHAKQVEILKELMSQLDEHRNIDGGVQYRLPLSDFASPDIAEKEWKTLFREHPQVIGLSGDLPENGSYFTIEDFGASVLATRGKDGVFRAFLNACTHRGARVAQKSEGKAARFTCPYHGWTFANNGKLLAVPDLDQFGAVDKSCMGLVELPAAEVAGILFVHPQADATLDVDALLDKELREEIENWGLQNYVRVADLTLEKQSNWKLANDTFGETYHFAKLHKDTLSAIYFGNNTSWETFGRNHRFLSASKAIDALRGIPEDEWNLFPAAYCTYYLFPNVHAVCYSMGMNLVRIYPDPENPGKSCTKIVGYYSPEVNAEYERAVKTGDKRVIGIEDYYDATPGVDAILSPEAALEAFVSTVDAEDYMMCEQQQLTAASGQLEFSLFGRNEAPLHFFHSNFRDALGRPPMEKVG